MREYDRDVLIERLERDGATVGARIPEELEIDGTTVALRETVFELAGADELSDRQREQIISLKRGLRGLRREYRHQLEHDVESVDAGEEIVATVAEIDRALNALDGVGGPSVAEAERQRQRTDQRRWLAFLREALGHDTGRR